MKAALLLALVLLCTVACGGGSGGNATPTRNLHPDNPAFDYLNERPLNLPIVPTANDDCPVTQSQLLSPTLPVVLGDGPVYPTGLGNSASLHLNSLPAGGEWLGGPVVWLAQPEFEGKVLIRGGRVQIEITAPIGEVADPKTLLGFDYGSVVPVEPTGYKLELDTETTSPDPDGWWQWHSYARATEPGCYAFQVDTDDGTAYIVFEAVES